MSVSLALALRGHVQRSTHFGVFHLRKVGVIQTDRPEALRRVEADDLIGKRSDLVQAVRRRHGNRADEALRMTLPYGVECRLHGSPGRQPIVDHDHNASFYVIRTAIWGIERTAPTDDFHLFGAFLF